MTVVHKSNNYKRIQNIEAEALNIETPPRKLSISMARKLSMRDKPITKLKKNEHDQQEVTDQHTRQLKAITDLLHCNWKLSIIFHN